MSTNAQFLGGVKSIQRGAITLATGTASAAATITSVVPGKTELRYLGTRSTDSTPSGALATVVLTNATTVTAARANSANDTFLSWELTEFY